MATTLEVLAQRPATLDSKATIAGMRRPQARSHWDGRNSHEREPRESVERNAAAATLLPRKRRPWESKPLTRTFRVRRSCGRASPPAAGARDNGRLMPSDTASVAFGRSRSPGASAPDLVRAGPWTT